MKKVFIKTFGCQMNEYDSKRIYDSISKVGYYKSEDQNNVDCFILNTCHIRDKAKEKVFHEIGRVKKIYRGKTKPLMVVAGCVAHCPRIRRVVNCHNCVRNSGVPYVKERSPRFSKTSRPSPRCSWSPLRPTP